MYSQFIFSCYFQQQPLIIHLSYNTNQQQTIMTSSFTQSLHHPIQSSPYQPVTSNYINPNHFQTSLPATAFPQTFTVRQGDQTAIYKPTLKLSGYIIGEPVTFTERPTLPKQYKQFSPVKENIIEPVFIHSNTITNSPTKYFNISSSPRKSVSNDYILQQRLRTVSLDPPQIKITNNKTPTEMINKQQFDRLLLQNTKLRGQNIRLIEQNRRLYSLAESKSTQLTELSRQNIKVTQLQRQITRLNLEIQQKAMVVRQRKELPMNINIKQMEIILEESLQKYRLSILQQQKLLIDRFRLQCKNQELDSKKQQMLESRRQQPENSFVRSSLKDSKIVICSHLKEPRHWKKAQKL